MTRACRLFKAKLVVLNKAPHFSDEGYTMTTTPQDIEKAKHAIANLLNAITAYLYQTAMAMNAQADPAAQRYMSAAEAPVKIAKVKGMAQTAASAQGYAIYGLTSDDEILDAFFTSALTITVPKTAAKAVFTHALESRKAQIANYRDQLQAVINSAQSYNQAFTDGLSAAQQAAEAIAPDPNAPPRADEIPDARQDGPVELERV